MLDFNNYTVN